MGKEALIVKNFLLFISAVFSRLSTLFSNGKHLHNARFADLHEIAHLLTNQPDKESCLLFGEGQFNHMLTVRPTKDRRELGNVLICAPTRAGKGLLAVSQLLTWPHSVIVNDIKGDLFTQTAGYRSQLGKVFVFDPTGIGHSYDPLSGKKTEDEMLSAATQLLHKPNEGEGAIFTQRATVMLTQMFLAARKEKMPPLPYVRQMIRATIPAAAERLNSLNPELAAQFLDMEFTDADFSDRFLMSAWATLSTRMRLLLTEKVVRSLTASDFTASDIMCGKTPTTVYLRWNERDLLAHTPLVRLIFGSLIAIPSPIKRPYLADEPAPSGRRAQ